VQRVFLIVNILKSVLHTQHYVALGRCTVPVPCFLNQNCASVRVQRINCVHSSEEGFSFCFKPSLLLFCGHDDGFYRISDYRTATYMLLSSNFTHGSGICLLVLCAATSASLFCGIADLQHIQSLALWPRRFSSWIA
jgi:hypothetical protein